MACSLEKIFFALLNVCEQIFVSLIGKRKKNLRKFIGAEVPRAKERACEQLETHTAEKVFAAKLVCNKLADAWVQAAIFQLTETKGAFVEIEIVSVVAMEVILFQDAIGKCEQSDRLKR